jgi:hypothetical protein
MGCQGGYMAMLPEIRYTCDIERKRGNRASSITGWRDGKGADSFSRNSFFLLAGCPPPILGRTNPWGGRNSMFKEHLISSSVPVLVYNH